MDMTKGQFYEFTQVQNYSTIKCIFWFTKIDIKERLFERSIKGSMERSL